MPSNEYHFITHWRVQSTCQEISDILGNAQDLPRWWPSVYLEVETLEPGQPSGLGKVIGLYTKGWLPYTLRWCFRVSEVNTPHGFALEAFGDFVGRGIWTFRQNGALVDITYDWKINAEKPLLRNLSFIFKPIFAANHQWAMRKGLESLELELARRQARTSEERSRIPAPPPPTFVRPSSVRQSQGS
ncbi:MAG: polyketide cyclase [Thermaceae bacterium]|nr:polyketide cyclase [Thermaceae bacterium]